MNNLAFRPFGSLPLQSFLAFSFYFLPSGQVHQQAFTFRSASVHISPEYEGLSPPLLLSLGFDHLLLSAVIDSDTDDVAAVTFLI